MSIASTPSIAAFYEWFLAPLGAAPQLPELCNTRDQLNARLSGLSSDSTRAGLSEGDSAYLVSVAGEIGNNCFDHNLGKWGDLTGGILAWGSHQQPAEGPAGTFALILWSH